MDGAVRRGGLTVAVLVGAALLLAAAMLDRQGLAEAPAATADAIVVLGCRVEPDGEPSACLAARTDAAVALFREGRAPKLVLTGGVTGGGVAEAGVAARRAADAGVPTDALIVEGRSTSTEENALFATQLLPPGRVILVTDASHVPRALRCFRAAGHEATAAPVRQAVLPRAYGAVREVLASAYYAASGRCTSGS